jgi:alpha-N-arabinofuranosidase
MNEAAIVIYPDEVLGRISPLLYGQNLSHLCGSVERGIDPQMLRDQSFEAESDSIRRGISGGWHRVGFGLNQASYALDTDAPFNGKHSQRVEITTYTNGMRGIGQGGLWVVGGEAYHGAVYLKQRGADGPLWVEVALRSGETVYARQRLDPVGEVWARYPFTLTPSTSTDEADLWITFAQRATLWIDQVTLLPATTYRGHGWRVDLMERLVRLSPTCIRWPGGWPAEWYRWAEGVGDPDRRPARSFWYSDVRQKTHRTVLPNRFGTDEFIRFCRDLEAEPSLVVSSGYEDDTLPESVVENAAAWVEYCNGPPSSPWGRLRAAHGSPESYHVRWWELGNEPWELPAEEYAGRVIRLAEAMRAKDPSIQLIAAAGPAYDTEWTNAVIRRAGSHVDGLALHRYYTGDYRNAMAEPLNYLDYIEEIGRRWRALVPDRPPRFFINEWNSNTTWFDATKLKEALHAACLLNAFERRGDLIEGAACCDWIRDWEFRRRPASEHSVIWYRQGKTLVTPMGLVLELYRRFLGTEAIRVDVSVENLDTEIRQAVPCLDVAASRDTAGQRLFVKVVNRDRERAFATHFELRGAVRRRAVRAWGLGVIPDACDPVDTKNTFEQPDAVTIEGPCLLSSEATDVDYELPPHSVTVIEWAL